MTTEKLSEERKREIIKEAHECLDSIERCMDDMRESAESSDNLDNAASDAEIMLLTQLIDARAKLARLNRDHKKLRKQYYDLSIENSELRKQIEELRASWAVRLPYDWARIK